MKALGGIKIRVCDIFTSLKRAGPNKNYSFCHFSVRTPRLRLWGTRTAELSVNCRFSGNGDI